MKLKVPAFGKGRTLVVGDLMLDRYWHGDTHEISPEAPVPVIKVREIEERPGGAANVALNIASLGAGTALVGFVGIDPAAVSLRARLETAGVNCAFIALPAFPTITKLRVISRNQQLLRADFESPPEPGGDLILAEAEAHLAAADMVVLSDYDKGVLDDPQPLIAAARKRGKPVLVDPKFKEFGRYAGAMLIKPNLRELEAAIGRWRSEAEMYEKCQQLLGRHQFEALLVTRGEQGMTLMRRGEKEVHLPARSREVFDVTGAGDTAIAVLAASLAAGEPLLDAVALANIAGGMVVTHAGTAAITSAELRREVADDAEIGRGVLSESQLLLAVEAARFKGERIVFTNGCFDLLHAGHVDYLAEAAGLGDRLIVALNDDESVTRLKGAGRPINQLERRQIVIAGLESVDWVTSFADDTPERLLELIRPEVLVKGGDYSVDQVVGGAFVSGYGGEVRVLKYVEDDSTTALVERIRKL